MAEQTSLGLTKSSLNEFYDKLVDNANLDLLDQLIANRIEKSLIAHNLLTENTEMVLGADQGKVLDDKISTLTNNLAGQSFASSDITIATGYSILSNRFTAKVVNGRIMLYIHVGINTGTIPTGILSIVTGIPAELNPAMPIYTYAHVDAGDFLSSQIVPAQLSANQINVNITSTGKTRIGLLIECSK